MATDLAADIAHELRAALRVTKADDDFSDVDDYEPGLSEFHDEIVAELTLAWLNAYRHANPTAVVDAAVQQQADTFAEQRADESGDDIGQATQDKVKRRTAAARLAGLTWAELRDQLGDDEAFGRARAETIGQHESAIAVGLGLMAAALDLGHDVKNWYTTSDRPCQDCLDNEDAGWIGIDETFPSGDDEPPIHPNCACGMGTKGGGVRESAPAAVVKEAVCVHCNRWLGRDVNASATLHCPKDGETRVRERTA